MKPAANAPTLFNPKPNDDLECYIEIDGRKIAEAKSFVTVPVALVGKGSRTDLLQCSCGCVLFQIIHGKYERRAVCSRCGASEVIDDQ